MFRPVNLSGEMKVDFQDISPSSVWYLSPTRAPHGLKELHVASALAVRMSEGRFLPFMLKSRCSSPPCSVNDYFKVIVLPIRIMWVEDKGRRNRDLCHALHGKPDSGRVLCVSSPFLTLTS